MSKYEEIKQLSDKYQSYHYPTMKAELGDHTYDGNTLIDHIPLLLKALELADIAYGQGRDFLDEPDPDYWLEQAQKEMAG